MFLEHARKHEDKTMVAKWAFTKPALTYEHLSHVVEICENHYLHVQLVPLLRFVSLYSGVVLEEPKLQQLAELRYARLLYNLGLQEKGTEVRTAAGEMRLDDNEKKICLENIKGLRDPNDDLKSKEVPFERLGARDPWVLETVRVH